MFSGTLEVFSCSICTVSSGEISSDWGSMSIAFTHPAEVKKGWSLVQVIFSPPDSDTITIESEKWLLHPETLFHPDADITVSPA
jgi:hypothetical protein